MRIPRIYHPDLIIAEQRLSLTPDAAHHVATVLRLKPGHPVVLFNGDGNEYSGQLSEVSKRAVDVEVDAKLSLSVESSLSIHLGQGVSKGDRMEWVIQKAVELGVTEITPLITARCAVKLSQERWQKKTQQWQKIIIGACEQSGRNCLPVLHSPVSLNQWMGESTQQLRLTLHPRADKRMTDLAIPPQGVRLLIGPEGGFDDNEVYATEESGFQSVRLGPRVMRTETAAIATISALQAVYGDL
ncbi:16S rRNA (uracil(1498)-N(3))-methyltransferase [Aestuariibacter halophilus]|uniref:Ribosomal RNA small subunit methyltransferase E n=1 Tax=Fluctibacter halophilus TaxID=226011 RepID=A0ABS8GBT8_9ALTE|nr:16S rRNA (uracil(1498)-N(3))-methyltransferase [Aestuariibacter halophilus]MCC2618047.1 16S rRNA (uracil(1498)-N(3))-methyltransferase [Aestuariibacter halophilus]